MKKESIVTSPWPIITALLQAESLPEMGSNLKWEPSNARQAFFLERYFNPLRDQAAAIPEIKSIISRNVAEVNAFLRQNNFSIQLDEGQPSAFAMASILDLLLKWNKKGTAMSIFEFGTNKEFPAFRLESQFAKFYESVGHQYPVAALRTKGSDLVFVTIAPRIPRDVFDLMGMIENINGNMMSAGAAYGGIQIPMVKLQKQTDVSWILNLETTGADGVPAWISQALMETKARMNEVGVRIEIAVAMATMRACMREKPRPDMVVNQPFLFWVKREKLPYPLVYAYIDSTDWKNPESIEE